MYGLQQRMLLLGLMESLLRPTLSTVQSKQHCCHVNCKTHKLSATYVPLPGLVATSIVAVLQMTKALVKRFWFKCTIVISIMSQLWANSYKAHEYTHYKHRKVICKCIQSQRALLLCQLWTSCGQMSVPSPYSTIYVTGKIHSNLSIW